MLEQNVALPEDRSTWLHYYYAVLNWYDWLTHRCRHLYVPKGELHPISPWTKNASNGLKYPFILSLWQLYLKKQYSILQPCGLPDGGNLWYDLPLFYVPPLEWIDEGRWDENILAAWKILFWCRGPFKISWNKWIWKHEGRFSAPIQHYLHGNSWFRDWPVPFLMVW